MAKRRLTTMLTFTLLSHGIMTAAALHANEQSLRRQQRAVSYGKIHPFGQTSKAPAARREEHAEQQQSEAGQEGVMRRSSGAQHLQINPAGEVLEESMLHQQAVESHFKIGASRWIWKASDFLNGFEEWRAEHKSGRLASDGHHLQINPAGELLEETKFAVKDGTDCGDLYLNAFGQCMADCSELCGPEWYGGSNFLSCTAVGIGSGATGNKCEMEVGLDSAGPEVLTSSDCASAIIFDAGKIKSLGKSMSVEATFTCAGATWSPSTLSITVDSSTNKLISRRDTGAIDKLTGTELDGGKYYPGPISWSNEAGMMTGLWTPKHEYYVASSNSACSKPITSSDDCETAARGFKDAPFRVGDQASGDRCYGCLLDTSEWNLVSFNSNTDGQCKSVTQFPVCKAEDDTASKEEDIFNPASIVPVDGTGCAGPTYLNYFGQCMADCSELCSAEWMKDGFLSCTAVGIGSGATGKKCKMELVMDPAEVEVLTSSDCASAIICDAGKIQILGKSMSVEITFTCAGATWSPSTLSISGDSSKPTEISRRDTGAVDKLTGTELDGGKYYRGPISWSNGAGMMTGLWTPKHEYYVSSSNSACSRPITSSDDCKSAASRLKNASFLVGDQASGDRCYGCLLDTSDMNMVSFNSNTDGQCQSVTQFPVCKAEGVTASKEEDIFNPASITPLADSTASAAPTSIQKAKATASTGKLTPDTLPIIGKLVPDTMAHAHAPPASTGKLAPELMAHAHALARGWRGGLRRTLSRQKRVAHTEARFPFGL